MIYTHNQHLMEYSTEKNSNSMCDNTPTKHSRVQNVHALYSPQIQLSATHRQRNTKYTDICKCRK
jgi:hypothetical protein